MAILQTATPGSVTRTRVVNAKMAATDAPVGQGLGSKVTDRKGRNKGSRTTSLRSQGVRALWFLSGIRESNCAKFHASLYRLLPALRLRIKAFLKANPEVAEAWGPFAVALLVEEVIAIAFENRDSWTARVPVIDWLSTFFETAGGVSSDSPTKTKKMPAP